MGPPLRISGSFGGDCQGKQHRGNRWGWRVYPRVGNGAVGRGGRGWGLGGDVRARPGRCGGPWARAEVTGAEGNPARRGARGGSLGLGHGGRIGSSTAFGLAGSSLLEVSDGQRGADGDGGGSGDGGGRGAVPATERKSSGELRQVGHGHGRYGGMGPLPGLGRQRRGRGGLGQGSATVQGEKFYLFSVIFPGGRPFNGHGRASLGRGRRAARRDGMAPPGRAANKLLSVTRGDREGEGVSVSPSVRKRCRLRIGGEGAGHSL